MTETLRPRLKTYRVSIPAYIDEVDMDPQLVEMRHVAAAFGVHAAAPQERLYVAVQAHTQSEAGMLVSEALAAVLMRAGPRDQHGNIVTSIRPAPPPPSGPNEGER